MSKKIRHIIHLSSSEIWRGAEQQIIYLYEGLEKAGHTQIIFCNEQGKLAEYCQEKHLNFKAYHKKNGLNLNLAIALKRYAKKNPADIIHIHDPHAHHAYLAAGLTGLNIPALLHRRVDFPTARNIFSAWKYQYHGIKKIICVSKRVKQTFVHRKNLLDKCRVMYDCTDYLKYRKLNNRFLLEKEFPQLEDKFVVANIAALVDHKDHPTFIKAAHYLVNTLKVKDLHFLIVGEGEKKEELQNLIKTYTLENDITMLGFRKAIPDILSSVNLYTFTSKMEGFGSTVLEAMAAGVPIVASKIGGPGEIFTHKKEALLFEPGDYSGLAYQIQDIINHPDLASNLTLSAFEKLKYFTIPFYTEQMEDIYKDIL